MCNLRSGILDVREGGYDGRLGDGLRFFVRFPFKIYSAREAQVELDDVGHITCV